MRSLLGAAHFQQKEIHGERQRRGEYPKHCPLRADRRELYREQRRRVYGRARNQAHRIPPARSEQAKLSHRRRAYERAHERGRKSGSRHRQTRKAARFRQAYSGRPATDRRPRGSERKRHTLGRGICRAHRRHSGQARARGYAEHGAAGKVQLLLHSGYGQEQNKPYGNPLGHARNSIVGQHRSEDTQRHGTCGIYRAFQKTRSIGRYCRTPRGVFQAYFCHSRQQAALALRRYGVSFESTERLGRGTVRSAEYKGRDEAQTRGKVQSLKADRHGDHGTIHTGERQSEQDHRQDDARRNAFGAARAAAKRQRGTVRHDLYHYRIRRERQSGQQAALRHTTP